MMSRRVLLKNFTTMRLVGLLLVLLLVTTVTMTTVVAFTASYRSPKHHRVCATCSSFLAVNRRLVHATTACTTTRTAVRTATTTTTTNTLVMRDLSASYWFQVGDVVQVVESVIKAGVDLKGRTGRVVQTWEKCEVDPACCCAEQVDINMAVRVEFGGAGTTEALNPSMVCAVDTSFVHYFGEAELIKQPQPQEQEEEVPTAAVAFDGISCTAFKLDALKMGAQAQRLAAFEASRGSDSHEE